MKHEIELSVENIKYQYSSGNEFELNVDNLHYSFIEPLAVYGLSGVGKTTFGKILAKLIQPKKNEKICFFRGGNKKLQIMYATQFPENIFLGDTIRHTLNVIISNNPDLEDLYQKLKHYLAFFYVNLDDIIHKNGYELSGGELRRFALALCISCDPDVLILDEPTIGLEEKSKAQLCEIAKEFNRENALLIISHDYKLLEKICGHLWVMDKGQLIFDGKFSDISEDFALQKRVGLNYYIDLDRMKAMGLNRL